MYYNGLFNLDDWDGETNYIILDDFDIKFFPNWKSFIGCQKQFTVTDKYRGKRTVKWGKPCIWLNNDDPRESLSRSQSIWLEANTVILNIGSNKLY